jgi:hypothetical protein
VRINSSESLDALRAEIASFFQLANIPELVN